jgi:hypothetical protein
MSLLEVLKGKGEEEQEEEEEEEEEEEGRSRMRRAISHSPYTLSETRSPPSFNPVVQESFHHPLFSLSTQTASAGDPFFSIFICYIILSSMNPKGEWQAAGGITQNPLHRKACLCKRVVLGIRVPLPNVSFQLQFSMTIRPPDMVLSQTAMAVLFVVYDSHFSMCILAIAFHDHTAIRYSCTHVLLHYF